MSSEILIPDTTPVIVTNFILINQASFDIITMFSDVFTKIPAVAAVLRKRVRIFHVPGRSQ